ncbi:MAG: septum formation initiator family protein [Patescibacteria group bacterium]|jgi:cell division protein FtsB
MSKGGGGKKGIFLLATMIVAGIFVFGFGREYLREREIAAQIASLEAENYRLDGKKLEFLDLIDKLSSQYYLEGQARTKEGLAKPGETLLVVDAGQSAIPVTSGKVLGATDSLAGVNNPTRWFYYFFDRTKFEDMSKL